MGKDVIMTSFPKAMAMSRPLKNWSNYIYHTKGRDRSYPEMFSLSNLNNFVKSCGNFCEILLFFP